jgi:hypothetical protein
LQMFVVSILLNGEAMLSAVAAWRHYELPHLNMCTGLVGLQVHWRKGAQQFAMRLLPTTDRAISLPGQARVAGSVTLQLCGTIQRWGCAAWCPHNLLSRLSSEIQTITLHVTGMLQLPGSVTRRDFGILYKLTSST